MKSFFSTKNPSLLTINPLSYRNTNAFCYFMLIKHPLVLYVANDVKMFGCEHFTTIKQYSEREREIPMASVVVV